MPRTESHDCYAVTPPGIEALAARELSLMGVAPGAVAPGGVSFRATPCGIARANIELRSASRVLVRVATFHASAFHELERRTARLPWETYVAPGRAVSFRVTSHKSKLYHQDAIAQRLASAVARRVPGAIAAAGPAIADDPEATEPPSAQLFVVRLFRDECTVSADASGAHLHQRGYRLATAKAPMRETLAAAMLLAVGWDGSAPLVDPLCGAGTIPIEAALLARRIAPGLGRGFACEQWPGFDAGSWPALREKARSRVLPRARVRILGSDRDAGAIEASTDNARRAGVLEDVEFRRAALSVLAPPGGPGVVITNPPYGVRVGRSGDLRDLYAQLGHTLRRRCAGWRVAFLSARHELAAQTRFDLQTVLRTTNGGIRVKLLEATVPPPA
ncbi:MAG TPA: class I SAM-dependent RNA methyltransferase [Gemmatimonadales bacterium]|nr:class I SAM-dependent RNA methyltransferase [Gemmatimonadales bacterium]